MYCASSSTTPSIPDAVTAGCALYVSLWSFVYVQSTLATIVLTTDRYLKIAFLFTYDNIVTRKFVGAAVALCWAVPGLLLIFGYLTTPPCTTPHMGVRNKYATSATAVIVGSILVTMYALYAQILFSFWRLKRRRSVMMRKAARDISSLATRKTSFTVVKLGCLHVKQSLQQTRKSIFFCVYYYNLVFPGN